MSGDGRLWHTCQLHSGSPSAAEGVAGVVVGRLVEMVTDPAAERAGECYVGQWGVGGGGVEEEGKPGLAKAWGDQCRIGGEGRHWAEGVVAADDGDGSRDERSFAERDREVNTPRGRGDVLCEKA
jgi:hypothetical protein